MPKIPKLYIPVGIPGCGKSTFAERLGLGKYPGIIVSTDKIRERLTGDINDQTRNREVFEEFHRRVAYYLGDNGVNVFADATNLDKQSRQTLRDIADLTESETHLLLFSNLDEAILRNRRRERVVPDDVMTRMMAKYERAKIDIYQEIYNSVTEIRSIR